MTLTATADAEAPLVPPAEAPAFAAQERPVFAATTPARPRALKLAGRVTAGLVALWLVALVLGTFGFGPVAGIGLPRIGGGGGESKPQRAAVHKAQPQQSHERVTSSGVTLTTRHGGPTDAPASRSGNTRVEVPRRAAGHQAPASRPGGSTRSTTPSGGGSHATAQTPAATSTPSSTAPPTSSTTTTTTTTTNPHANTTHSQATPPGSSSTAPGSRSNAGTAPGRDQSTSSPTPGSGRTEHAPPKG